MDGVTGQFAKSKARKIIVPWEPEPLLEGKVCSGCKQWVLFDGFNRNRTNFDGLQTFCRQCDNAANKKNEKNRKKR